MLAVPMGRTTPDVLRLVSDPWDCEWPHGRMIWPVAQHTEAKVGVQETLLREGGFGANDVLGIRLYQGCLQPGPVPPRDMLPVPDFRQVAEVLREVGPGLRGVVVGNQGYELSYRHHYGNWDGNWKGNLGDCREFMLRAGGLLREMGIQPFFALMDWELLQDAYRGDGILLETLEELDAINYVHNGHTLVPGAYVLDDPRFGDQMRWQSREEGRGWRLWKPGEDLTVMRDYLLRGRFWSGVGGPEGVLAGNLTVMYEFGFSGFVVDTPRLGLVGEIMEQAVTGQID